MSAADPSLGLPQIERWTEPSLPESLSPLLAEAVGAGVVWMGDFREDWRRRPFVEAGEGLFLAFSGPVPVAMAAISEDQHVPGTNTGRLRYIYVGEGSRGRGLFRPLIEACLHRGGSRWRRLRLHTDNPVAAKVYEGYGFAAVTGDPRCTHRRDL